MNFICRLVVLCKLNNLVKEWIFELGESKVGILIMLLSKELEPLNVTPLIYAKVQLTSLLLSIKQGYGSWH